MKKIWLILTLTLLTACSATGPKYTAVSGSHSGMGMLYIYRPSTFVNSAIAPSVFINNQEKPKLLNGGYQQYELAPGNYSVKTDGNFISWTPGRAIVSVKVEAGKSSYVRLGSHVAGSYVISGARNLSIAQTGATLVHVSEELALKELPDTSLSM